MAIFKYKSVVQKKSYLNIAGNDSLEDLFAILQSDAEDGLGGLNPTDGYKISPTQTRIAQKQGDLKLDIRGDFEIMENGSYSGTIKSIKSKTLDLETKITMTLKGLSLSTNNLAYTSKKELQENIFKGDDRFEFSAKTKGLYKTSSSYGGSFGTDGTIILGDGNDKLTVKGPIHLSNLLATGNGQDEIILRPTKEGQPTGLRLIDLDINDEINVSKMKIWNNSASCSYSPTRWNIIADTENYEQILLSTDGVTCKEANIVT